MWRSTSLGILMALCLAATLSAHELELVARRDRLQSGRVTTTGIVRNVSGKTIEDLRVYIAYHTKHGDLVRSMTGRVRSRKFWIFPSHRLGARAAGKFKIMIPYHPDMKQTMIGFNARGVMISHRRVR